MATAAGDVVWLANGHQRQVTYGKRSHFKSRGTSSRVEQNRLSSPLKKASLPSAARSRPKLSSTITSRTSSPKGRDKSYNIESSDEESGHQHQHALLEDNPPETQTTSARSTSQSPSGKDQYAAFDIPSSDDDRKRKRQQPISSGSKKRTKLEIFEDPRLHRKNPTSSSLFKPKTAPKAVRTHIRSEARMHAGTEQELLEQFERDLRTASPRPRTPRKQSNRRAGRNNANSSRVESSVADPASENVTDSTDELSRNVTTTYRSSGLKPKETYREYPVNIDRNETTPPPPKFHQNAITPKQSQLWMNLLEESGSEAGVTSSEVGICRIQPVLEHSAGVLTTPPAVRAPRLVDRMKASERRRRHLPDPDLVGVQSTTHPNKDLGPVFEEEIEEVDQQANPLPSTSLLSSPSQPQQSVKNMHNAEPRRTYGGSRSYLSEESSSLEQLLSQPLGSPEPQIGKTNRSRGADHEKSGKRSLFDMDESDEDSAGRMKSLHELRASGSTERSKNYMEDLIQDVGSGVVPMSKKYSALLDLCRKLKDVSFQELLVQTGHLQRLADIVADVTDPLMGVCLAMAINILLPGPFGIQVGPTLYACNISKMLTHLLEHHDGVMRLVQRSKDKFSRHMITAMKNALTHAVTFAKFEDAGIMAEQLSPQLIGLKALETLIRCLREAHAEEQPLTSDLVDQVLGLLENSAKVENHGNGGPSKASILQQELVFSLLESATLAQPDTVLASQWSSRNLRLLVKSIARVMQTLDLGMSSVRKLALRLCLNVANNNPENCAVFADGRFLVVLLTTINSWFAHPNFGESSDSSNEDMDELLLALGAAINLAECSAQVRDSVLRNAEEPLLHMVTTFRDRRDQAASAESIEASRANVAYGYLAVLLGNLCQSELVREVTKSKLPGKRLTPLIHAVDEFTAYHKAADKGAGANDVWSAFTERLQAVADSLRRLDG